METQYVVEIKHRLGVGLCWRWRWSERSRRWQQSIQLFFVHSLFTSIKTRSGCISLASSTVIYKQLKFGCPIYHTNASLRLATPTHIQTEQIMFCEWAEAEWSRIFVCWIKNSKHVIRKLWRTLAQFGFLLFFNSSRSLAYLQINDLFWIKLKFWVFSLPSCL